MTKRGLDDSIQETPRADKVSRVAVQHVNRPTKEIGQCAAGCGQSVMMTPTPAGIPCFTCNAFTHFKCAGITTTAKGKLETIRKTFMNKSITLYYLCVTCAKEKAQLRPSNVPTEDELKKKLKTHEKEIDNLTTVIYDTESKTEQLRKVIEEKKKDTSTLFSPANIQKLNELIRVATAPLLQQIRELRDEITNLKTTKKVIPIKPAPKEPPKIVENVKSFAEILFEKGATMDAIRNITIAGELAERESILNNLRADPLIQENLITTIRDTGEGNYTIKCPDAASADELMTQITARYPRIAIKNVAPKKPHIKITGIPVDMEIVDELFPAEIEINNPWFIGEAKFVREYTVRSETPYKCAVLEVSLDLMRACMSNKRIQFGFNVCRVYEESNLIQCKKCYQLGHMARSCKMDQKCRRCGATDHDVKNCTNEIKCFNCSSEIERGLKLPTNHLVTEDRCYIKKRRLEALKTYLMNND